MINDPSIRNRQRFIIYIFLILSTCQSFPTITRTSSNNQLFLSKQSESQKQYDHTLAILTLPLLTPDRIANEAILQHSIKHTSPTGKLSVILRCRDDDAPSGHSLQSLRRYMSELYSAAWDIMSQNSNPLNIIVYPHSLPNTPPESWLYHRPDLQCIISHDCILGWHSIGSHLYRDGEGGLTSHVDAINLDRNARNLKPVRAITVTPWPLFQNDNVDYLEDETKSTTQDQMVFLEEEQVFLEKPIKSKIDLFKHVAVGGTFDGMHYGHRKLLTLAVSSVEPIDGQLLVGITSDSMLSSKTLSEYIPPLQTRIQHVKQFLDDLAPGLKNRYKIIVLEDAFGPPAVEEQYDALVLSHETLQNGLLLNDVRTKRGLKELKLLCTRRTEGNVMSSTMLRQWRKDKT